MAVDEHVQISVEVHVRRDHVEHRTFVGGRLPGEDGILDDGEDGRRIRLGSGEDVTVDSGDGEVQIDGETIGRLSNDGHALRLDLVDPLPELLPLLILLAFAEGTRVT